MVTIGPDYGSEMQDFPPLLDIPGVADMLSLSMEETRRLIGEGWIDHAGVKGRQLFHRDRVIEWLKNQRVNPNEP